MAYWSNGVGGCVLEDAMSCNKNEDYLQLPQVSGQMPYNNGERPYPITGVNIITDEELDNRAAFYIDNDGVNDFISSNSRSVLKNGEYYTVGIQVAYLDYSYVPPAPSVAYGVPSGTGIGIVVGMLATNIPVFETEAEANDYITTGEGIENALNYKDEEIEPDKTEVYHCYNTYGDGTQTNGEMVMGEGLFYYNNLRVQSNRRPVLYFDEGSYQMHAVYFDALSWYASSEYGSIEDVEVSDFWAAPVQGHTQFYGNIAAYTYATGDYLPDGDYRYGFVLDTDFAIFQTKEEAEEALNTGNYSGAANWPQISSGNTKIEIETGDEESNTSFGGGAFVSPFCNTYVMDSAALSEVANAFYTDDPSILENIEKGLKLFGANPYEAIIGLSAFPFDVTTMVGTSGQQYIYFGSYQKTLSNTVYKVVNRASHYINAGNVFLAPIFKNFRDFEPWTELHVYLPFCGWQKLDIASYIGKNVNIRYYVDIMTRSGVVVLVADGTMVDYFTTGEIGVELPVTGQNLSRYANDTLNALLQAGGGTVGGAVSGAMLGSAIPGVGTAVGAGMGALLGGGFGLAKGTFDMSQKGKPKDHNMTKGNFSGGCGCYMPQYVMFRFTVHDVIEPENLNSLYGKPSSYGGRLGNLSGFTKVDTIKMNTSGMSDNNITEVVNLVKEGIFL